MNVRVLTATLLVLVAGNGQGQTLQLPVPGSIPDGPTGVAIRRGQTLITDTRAQLPGHAGNDLNCSSCHLNGGTVAYAAPYVGLMGRFPEYRARSGRVISLQQRINACFQRSLNGSPLRWDSDDMNAILAYISWLSGSVPAGQPVTGRGFEPIDMTLEPDPKHGKAIYTDQCASCHGSNGQGATSDTGTYLYPPVWGARSFNLGAGMARHYTAAAFIRRNMPLGKGGSLSAQDAVDVAFYVTRQPRPDFPARVDDWPKGGRPKDAR